MRANAPAAAAAQNMRTAHGRNAIANGQFWFRHSTSKLSCTEGEVDTDNYEVRPAAALAHH